MVEKQAAAGQKRNRPATEARIRDAVGRVLARDGFAGLGVGAVAKEAGVDKVLIYRYFGGLPELLRSFGEQSDVWPSVDEFAGGDLDALRAMDDGERLSQILKSYGRRLRERPVTLEILAWELIEQNELTEVLNERRVAVSDEMVDVLGESETGAAPDLQAIYALLGAGQLLLALWARRRATYGGIGIRTDEDLERIEQAMDWLLTEVDSTSVPSESSQSE